jgi:teichuronic acid biosynthesis glycosyltransferase TuaC
VAAAGLDRLGMDPESQENLNAAVRDTQLRVLVLSRNYPNNVMDLLGLWVQGLVRQSATFCELKVISPVPYCPPLPGLPENYARFRRVERRRWDGNVESLHPRFVLGPGYSTHTVEWVLYLAAVRPVVQALRADFPFDLIHAHFTYPDGVVAAHLARQYVVPLVITEHNPWGPWMTRYPSVCRRAMDAARQSASFIVVSEYVRRTVEQFAGTMPNLSVIPCGVDGSVFTIPAAPPTRDPNQILFVGAIRHVKGVDLLLRALRLLHDRGRETRLVIVGEAFYGSYQQDERRLKTLVEELGLGDVVRFVGKQVPPELVQTMQKSAVLVLPSRAESLGMVLVEALACGTPVVATRCGGPEEIVNERVGVLVQPEDPEALARGLEQVLDRAWTHDPLGLRAHALKTFGLESVGNRLRRVYEAAVRREAHLPA